MRGQVIERLAVDGDSVRVSYVLPVPSITADQQAVLMPWLRSEADSVSLRSILVRGRRNAKLVHREFVLTGAKKRGEQEPEYLEYKNVRRGVADSVALPFDAYRWVAAEPVSLCVEHVKEGCCRVDTMKPVCSLPTTPEYAEQPQTPAGQPQDSVPQTIVDTVVQIVVQQQIDTVVQVVVHQQVDTVTQIVDNTSLAQTIDDYKPYDPEMAVSADSAALYVYFELDRININPSYMGNAARLDSLEHLISVIMADSTRRVRTIRIIGLASIEGNESHNNWLAYERGHAMKNYIQKRTSLADSQFEVINGGEAWNEVKYYIHNHEFNGALDVLRLIYDVKDNDKREALLRKMNGGATFKYLHNQLFRHLRYSAYLKVYYE